MVWKLSARSTASATWLATPVKSSRSASPSRPGSLELTLSTPNTRSLTRRGTISIERTPRARAVGRSSGSAVVSTSATTIGRPEVATRAVAERGSSRRNSTSSNRAPGATSPAIRWPRTTCRAGSTRNR